MAISSNINIDIVSGTTSCNIIGDQNNTIDILTYTNSNSTMTFAKREAIKIQYKDFQQKLLLVQTFNNSIINSLFSPSLQIIPFDQIVVMESNDGLILKWQFKIYDKMLFDFVCYYNESIVVIEKREEELILSYAQWLYFIYLIQRFQEVCRKNHRA